MQSRLVRGLLRSTVMHPALRRYVEPPRDFARYFGVGILVGLFLFAGAVSAATVIHQGDFPKTRITKAGMREYMFEAFPKWAQANPGRACPDSLTDLAPYLGRRDRNDAWGGAYQFSCALWMGHGRLAVWSLGEDELPGTSDDVWIDR